MDRQAICFLDLNLIINKQVQKNWFHGHGLNLEKINKYAPDVNTLC